MPISKLPPVNCQYGAPMGRQNKDAWDTTKPYKIYLQRMKMSRCGAYDEGGAYWGCSDFRAGIFPMWRYEIKPYPGMKEPAYGFLRAKDREDAKQQILEVYPNAKFFGREGNR